MIRKYLTLSFALLTAIPAVAYYGRGGGDFGGGFAAGAITATALSTPAYIAASRSDRGESKRERRARVAREQRCADTRDRCADRVDRSNFSEDQRANELDRCEDTYNSCMDRAAY